MNASLVEVEARISGDADRTAAEARGLWWLVDRPNLFIKIPATEAALPAIADSVADGISVNVSLIFSLERYKALVDCFLAGLERRKAAGGTLAGIESVASFFISRVDTEIDHRLSEIEANGGDDAASAKRLHGQAAMANARLAYEIYENMLNTPRWQALAASGARPQRLLWASTGVKDKAFEDTRYVVDLVAPDTANTMPTATLRAVVEHGAVRGDTIRAGYDNAWYTMDELKRLGVDIADVAATQEHQGVSSFVKSWNELIGSVSEKLKDRIAQEFEKSVGGIVAGAASAAAKMQQSAQSLSSIAKETGRQSATSPRRRLPAA